ncbi:MAG: hypothetical protein CMA55_01165 [Euryarchaeota archaeon]|nr:hypothetical protein [Euryarchaeota archaeon]
MLVTAILLAIAVVEIQERLIITQPAQTMVSTAVVVDRTPPKGRTTTLPGAILRVPHLEISIQEERLVKEIQLMGTVAEAVQRNLEQLTTTRLALTEEHRLVTATTRLPRRTKRRMWCSNARVKNRTIAAGAVRKTTTPQRVVLITRTLMVPSITHPLGVKTALA